MSTTPNNWNWDRISQSPKLTMDHVELPEGEHWNFSSPSVFETLKRNKTSFANGNIVCREFRDNEKNLLMQIPLLLRGVSDDKIRDAFQYSLQVMADRFGYNYANDTFTGKETFISHYDTVKMCDDIHNIIIANESESIIKLIQNLLRGTGTSVDACKVAFEFLGL